MRRRSLAPSAAPLLLLLLSLVSPPGAGAQGSPELVPEDLALALLATEGFAPGGTDEILVGRAPDAFPTDALPEGTRILGSAEGRERSIVAVLIPRTPEEARTVVGAKLEEIGWERRSFGPRAGFVKNPAELRRLGVSPFAFCRDGVSLDASVLRHAAGTLLRITLLRGRHSACRRPSLTIPVPTLVAPADAVLHGSGGSGSEDGWDMRARMVTGEAAPAVVARFAEQMQAQGWVPSDDAAQPGATARTLRLREPDGEEWTGVLSAAELPALREVEVSLSIRRGSPRAPGERPDGAPGVAR